MGLVMSMMERTTFVDQGARLEVEAMENMIHNNNNSAGLEATSDQITLVIVVGHRQAQCVINKALLAEEEAEVEEEHPIRTKKRQSSEANRSAAMERRSTISEMSVQAFSKWGPTSETHGWLSPPWQRRGDP
jgi:hypothetical protein